VTLGIKHRASRVASCSVVIGNKAYRHIAVISVPAEIFLLIQFLQPVRHIVIIDLRVVLLHHTGEGRLMLMVNGIT